MAREKQAQSAAQEAAALQVSCSHQCVIFDAGCGTPGEPSEPELEFTIKGRPSASGISMIDGRVYAAASLIMPFGNSIPGHSTRVPPCKRNRR